MAMNSSGPISLGGATAGQSINLENGNSATAQVSLNDTAVRNLAGVASGAITMPTDFYGKSNIVNISYTFSSTTADASLNLSALPGYSSGKTVFTVTVNSGVYLYATSTGSYGLNLSGATTGDTVTIVNNGYIMGKGGCGGSGYNSYGPYMAGDPGGPALNLGIGVNPTITNTSGYIGGGGGGGAGCAGYSAYGGPGNGGGGAGGGNGGSNQTDKCSTNNGGGPGSSGGTGGDSSGYSGGGGGRIMPGTGGAGNYGAGSGGGAGGGGGGSSVGGNGGSGGASGQAGQGSSNKSGSGGGGGGYGASGGTFKNYGNFGGTTGSGGKGVNLNGRSITWTGGAASSSRVYGTVS